MGNKTKQSQRTKNNVRPSSSSRSAEILNNSVSLDGGSASAAGGKVLPALFPSLAALNIDQGLNPKFQICLKKLNKKDPITRAKAVQELCDLVSNGNEDDVVAALPSWAHAYKALTFDTDRKVREVTQMCHHAIMRVCGRRSAPQLKSLLPSWLQAQYDEHAPAQTNAQLSLKSTFPDKKLPEVMSFCKDEVMAHLHENLIGNTEEIISKKIENPEERDLQMGRIVASSLRGLEYFTPSLPAKHHDWLWEQLTPLLDAAAYWKYASHNSHQVRAAWYGAMGRIVERYKGQFGEKYGLKSTRLMLNAAKDRNAQVAAEIWTCLLQFMHNIEEWHKYLDKRDLLVKRILDVLETGGWGDAKHLSTMLLPLLAHLPEDMMTKLFYESFFKAVYKGLDNKNVLISKTEQRAWITSLAECLRYLSIQQKDFVVEVTTSVHRVWVEKVLVEAHDEQTKNNLIKCSATSMVSLVKYWLKQSKENNSEKYEQLLRNFWQNIGSTVLAQIDKCGVGLEELQELIHGHITLLQTLKTSFMQETKKQQSIKFHGDKKPAEDTTPVASQQLDASIVERYRHNLDELVDKICAHYFEKAEKKHVSNTILAPLITLLIEFDSKNMFVSLARQFNVDSPYKLYEKVLQSWLIGDTMRCKAVVDIIFVMSKYLSEDEQDAMFDSFRQFTPAVVEWCLSVCLSHPYIEQSASRRWAQSAAAAQAVAGLARRAATHGDVRATALLFMCLADAADGEPLISDEGVSQITRTVAKAIEDHKSRNLESSGALAARLVTTLASTDQPMKDSANFSALVLNLYKINLHQRRGVGSLTPETWCEILSSWQDGVAVLPDDRRKQFLVEVTRLTHQELFKDIKSKLDIAKLEHIVSLCPYLFNSSVPQGSDQPADLTEIAMFTEQIFDMDNKEDLFVETCALRYMCVTSQLNCPYGNNDAIIKVIEDSSEQNIKEMSKSDVLNYVNKHMFHVIYMKTMLLHKLESDDAESDQRNPWCDTLLMNSYIQAEYCKTLHFYSIMMALSKGYTFWPHYEVIEAAKQRHDTILQEVTHVTSAPVRDAVVQALLRRATTDAYFWAFAHRIYINSTSNEDTEQIHLTDFTPYIGTKGFYHMLQAATYVSRSVSLECRGRYLLMLRCCNIAFAPGSGAFFDALDAGKYELNIVIDAYYKKEDNLLYEVDITNAPWEQVVSNVAIVQFIETMVRKEGWSMASHYWDFTTISLCSMISSIRKSQHNWGCTKVAMLSVALAGLFSAVRRFVRHIPRECEREQPLPHVANLVKEWADIFAPDCLDSLYHCFVHVLSTAESNKSLTVPKSEFIQTLIQIAPEMEYHLLDYTKSTDLTLKNLAQVAAQALEKPIHPGFKFLAYHMLVSMSKDLVFNDAQKLSTWSAEHAAAESAAAGNGNMLEELNTVFESLPVLSLDNFRKTYEDLLAIVEAAISHVEPGETICDVVPFTDSHSLMLGWLLLADVMEAIFTQARGDLKQYYLQIYRLGKYGAPQLAACLRLLPSAVFLYSQDSTGNTPLPISYSENFIGVGPFCMKAACDGTELRALACRGMLAAVSGAGCAAARGWWGAARPNVARAVEKLVTAFVAPHAVKNQFDDLSTRVNEIEDCEIRIAWSSWEVVCDYTVEESTLQLRIQMMRAHPLVPPRLTAPVVTGPGNNTQWITLYLAYQNGTVLNALKMWTETVNTRVEKAPQCYICYCRLHPGTGRLPRVPCHQCKNKFHDMCLRKWFSTSNKSNCPLCRANF